MFANVDRDTAHLARDPRRKKQERHAASDFDRSLHEFVAHDQPEPDFVRRARLFRTANGFTPYDAVRCHTTARHSSRAYTSGRRPPHNGVKRAMISGTSVETSPE